MGIFTFCSKISLCSRNHSRLLFRFSRRRNFRPSGGNPGKKLLHRSPTSAWLSVTEESDPAIRTGELYLSGVPDAALTRDWVTR